MATVLSQLKVGATGYNLRSTVRTVKGIRYGLKLLHYFFGVLVMIKRIIFGLALPLLVAFSASADEIKLNEGLSLRASKAVHSALKPELLESYSAYLDAHLLYEYPNFQPKIETHLKSADIDIGIERQIIAVFINLGLWGFCGSGGCNTVGLIKIDGNWKEVIRLFDCTYRLLDTGKNGLRDIVADNCKYSNNRYQFHFNGQKYVEIE